MRSRCRQPPPRRRQAVRTAPTTTYEKLLDCVTLEGVRAHQQALQEIADARTAAPAPPATTGYAASVDYVVGLLEEGGLRRSTLDPFEFIDRLSRSLQQLTPVDATYETGAFTGSGFGDVDRSVTAVDINLVPREHERCDERLPKRRRRLRPGSDDFAASRTTSR